MWRNLEDRTETQMIRSELNKLLGRKWQSKVQELSLAVQLQHLEEAWGIETSVLTCGFWS